MRTHRSIRLAFVTRPENLKKKQRKEKKDREPRPEKKENLPQKVHPSTFPVSTNNEKYIQNSLQGKQREEVKQLEEIKQPIPILSELVPKYEQTLPTRTQATNTEAYDSETKVSSSSKCGYIFGIIASILSLIAIGVSVYIFVSSLLKDTTNMSTTTTAIVTLRWNSVGVTVAGTGIAGVNSTLLNFPFGLILDTANTLYIGDQNNSRVQRWAANGWSGTTVAGQTNGLSGSNPSSLNIAGGVAIDSTGGVYVTDMNNCRIQYWAAGASAGVTVAGTGTCGVAANQLNYPYSLTRDASTGTLYVADTNNHRVIRYTPGATSGTVVAGGSGAGNAITQLNYPIGLYFDTSSNSLVIANAGGNNIVRWIIGASHWTLLAGSTNGANGSTSTTFYYPVGVTLDTQGNVYVADTYNHRVQLFIAGVKSAITIAGSGTVPGNHATLLNNPCAVVLDNNLNLYVADAGNHRIQKFLRY